MFTVAVMSEEMVLRNWVQILDKTIFISFYPNANDLKKDDVLHPSYHGEIG